MRKYLPKALFIIIPIWLIVIGLFLFWPKMPKSVLSGNGTVESTQIIVSSQQAGEIKQVLVDEGDSVTKGQVLARIDGQSQAAQMASATAKIKQLELTIHSMDEFMQGQKAKVTFAQKEYDRQQELLKTGDTTVEKRDRAYKNLQKAKSNLEATHVYRNSMAQNLASAKSQQQELTIAINHLTVTAPSAGQVVYKLMQPGELAGPGTRLFVLQNPNNVYMTIYLPTSKVGLLKLNDTARVHLDAFPKDYFKAHVSFISAQAEFTPKQVQTTQAREDLVFRVKLTLDENPNDIIKPGMPGVGYVNTGKTWPHKMNP